MGAFIELVNTLFLLNWILYRLDTCMWLIDESFFILWQHLAYIVKKTCPPVITNKNFKQNLHFKYIFKK